MAATANIVVQFSDPVDLPSGLEVGFITQDLVDSGVIIERITCPDVEGDQLIIVGEVSEITLAQLADVIGHDRFTIRSV